MSQHSLWIRLNVDWSKSDWLIVLSAECRLVWIELLCYCKAYGNKRGSCPVRSTLSFARMCFVGEEAVTQLLIAAKAAGAIVESDGLWHLTGWSDYQSPEAARVAEHRAKAPKDLSVTNRNSNELYEFPVTRQQQQQQQQQRISNEIPKEKVRKEKTPGMGKPNLPEILEFMLSLGEPPPIANEESAKFFDHYEANGWKVGGKSPMRNWNAAARSWLRRSKLFAKSEPPKVIYAKDCEEAV